MRYSESPPVTGAHLHAVDFSEVVPVVSDKSAAQRVDGPSNLHVPVQRVGARGHAVPPRLEDYPDMRMTTPDRNPRTWLLPTGVNSGFTTLTDVSDDPELIAELSRVDATCSLLFHGALIGMITTRRPTHICEFPSAHAPTSLRCAGCRWFETRVFRLSDVDSRTLNDVRYVLHYVGRSIVPGEVDLPRHELAISGHEVVEAYTVRKYNERPFITKPGARVLAQASNYDPAIEDAYINRATA